MSAYFGDGGRNFFVLLVTVPLLLYSSLLWRFSRALNLVTERRAVWRGAGRGDRAAASSSTAHAASVTAGHPHSTVCAGRSGAAGRGCSGGHAGAQRRTAPHATLAARAAAQKRFAQ